MKSVHVNVTEDRYKCDKCTEAFSKKYMLVRHRLTNHIEKHIKETSEVVELCDVCNESFTSSKDKVEHYKKEHCDEDDIEVVETTSITSNEYSINEFPEKKEKGEHIWKVEEEDVCQGMRMKGNGSVYKEACTALKTNLTKGRIFKDSQ